MDRVLAGLCLIAVAAAPFAERKVADDGVVALSLEGATLRVRIDPAATAMPVFTDAAAVRAGLKGGMFGARFGVGPVKLAARTAVATLAIGVETFKRRVAWTATPFSADVDGVIGPGGLPDDVIRFSLAAPRPGEQTFALPMADSHWGVSGAVMNVGGVATAIRFDPRAPRTVATAAAGVALAAANHGTLAGEPAPAPIAFGISRPVRTLTLADPVVLGPLRFAQLAVRVADGGAANAIREADADPDEVRVVAKGKPGRSAILIGHDLLARCSSLVFDKPAKQVRLTCG